MQHLIFKTGALNYSANLPDIGNTELSDRATKEIWGCPADSLGALLVRSVMTARSTPSTGRNGFGGIRWLQSSEARASSWLPDWGQPLLRL